MKGTEASSMLLNLPVWFHSYRSTTGLTNSSTMTRSRATLSQAHPRVIFSHGFNLEECAESVLVFVVVLNESCVQVRKPFLPRKPRR